MLPQTTIEDRANWSPPFIGWCWASEFAFTICEWRYHPLRQRFALWTCPHCTEAAGGARQEHAIELLEVCNGAL